MKNHVYQIPTVLLLKNPLTIVVSLECELQDTPRFSHVLTKT